MATYIVKPGDTLSTIGNKLGVNWRKITGYRSGNPNLIYPGEVLNIPDSAPTGTVTAPLGSSERTKQLLEAASRFTGGGPRVLPEQAPTGQSPQGSPGTPGTVPAEDQELSILEIVAQYLENKRRQGQVINPDVQIGPKQILDFLAQAQSEIHPFFASQLKLARESLMRDLGFSTDEVLRQEKDLERQYGLSLRQLGESAAERGFALSGKRQLEERELARQTQKDIESSRRKLGFRAGTEARQFAQQFGTAQITPQTIGLSPRVIPGEPGFERPVGEVPLYELSPEVYQGLIGQREFEERAATKRRAAELESAFREKQTIPRTINF